MSNIFDSPQTKRHKPNYDDTATVKETDSKDNHFTFSQEPNLETIRKLHLDFCTKRNWGQFHTPRNVLLALIAEVGELAEIFQWKGEVKEGLPDFTESEKVHVGQEMSDVLLYLISLANRCHIDLPAAVLEKVKQNAEKYPPDKVYGKSNKYTDYAEKKDEK